MVDFFAENRFTITKPLFFEGMRRVSRENYGKFARKALLALLALWIILLVITLVTNGNLLQTLGYLAVLGFAGLWIGVIIPRSNAKRAYEKLRQQSADMDRTTRFYEDHMQIHAEDNITTIQYDQITQILRSKHLLVLVCADKRGILLSLDGFTKGNADTVCRHIEDSKREDTE